MEEIKKEEVEMEEKVEEEILAENSDVPAEIIPAKVTWKEKRQAKKLAAAQRKLVKANLKVMVMQEPDNKDLKAELDKMNKEDLLSAGKKIAVGLGAGLAIAGATVGVAKFGKKSSDDPIDGTFEEIPINGNSEE